VRPDEHHAVSKRGGKINAEQQNDRWEVTMVNGGGRQNCSSQLKIKSGERYPAIRQPGKWLWVNHRASGAKIGLAQQRTTIMLRYKGKEEPKKKFEILLNEKYGFKGEPNPNFLTKR